MKTMKTIPTGEKVTIENYPYGYTMKTTLFDTVEFNLRKGYRHITQTINPKTGNLNAPKKSTYFPLLVRYYDENGHIKMYVNHINGCKEINIATMFINENFSLFTDKEIKYLYTIIHDSAVIDFRSICVYGGSKMEEVKQFYSEFLKISSDGITDGLNHFAELVLDVESIEKTKPVDYNPFRTVIYK